MYPTHQPYQSFYPMSHHHHFYNNLHPHHKGGAYWNNHLQHFPWRDYGPSPFVVNIKETTKKNTNFRTALWTGKYMQLTLMHINAGDDIGLEVHHDHDQFIRVEQGQGIVKMGDRKNQLNFQEEVYLNYAIFIPAGKWHNIINTGRTPLKVYSIYAPPEHRHGTVHRTKREAGAHYTY